MKTTSQIFSIISASALLLTAPLAKAGNITIADNNTGSIVNGTLYTETSSGWYQGGGYVTGPASEYQEVEPGMQTGAQWDLAAFVNPGTGYLGVLSGYNLAAGYAGTTIGDIFVSVHPGSITPYGDPNSSYPQYNLNSQFNYNFAIHMDFATNSYTVIQLDANTVLENGEYAGGNGNYNSASQPWAVATTTGGLAGGDLGTVISTGYMYYTNTLDTGTASSLAGFSVTSDYSYYAQVGTSWLKPYLDPTNPQALFKLTMSCGNDNMLGYETSGFQTVPDNAATISLIGFGVLMLAGVAKFRARQIAR